MSVKYIFLTMFTNNNNTNAKISFATLQTGREIQKRCLGGFGKAFLILSFWTLISVIRNEVTEIRIRLFMVTIPEKLPIQSKPI